MKLLLALAAFVVLTSCAGSAPPEVSVTPGVVTVAISTPLPTGADIIIRIVEVSGPDRAVVGTRQAPAGASEYPVEYRKAAVKPEQSYGLEIVATAEGKTIFLNKKPYYVLTRGNPDRVTVELDRR